jgi:predicted dehydrogenase
MFIDALAAEYRHSGELVGLCDVSMHRMAWHNHRLQNDLAHRSVPCFAPRDFDQMLREQKVDVVIVTTVDSAHHDYIVRAMELGCDVITEKPMTTDASMARAILGTIARTGRRLRVAFNMRYTPSASKVYQLVRSGVIGVPKAVSLSWLLNTSHGADYFRRWHREKDKSGGLLVHKSSHHFDLVNWWIDSHPELVFALGGLNFYGRTNAELRGEEHLTTYSRYTGSSLAEKDPFSLSLESDPMLKGLYLDAEHDNGYIRDRNVFGDNITIEDTMSLLVRYQNGVTLNYSLICYSPWEGWHAAITGTKGRIEFTVKERKAHVSADNLLSAALMEDMRYQVTVHPLFDKPYEVPLPLTDGSHGGGDALILKTLFGPKSDDLLSQSADHVDGAASVVIGFAANLSMETGLPVRCEELIPLRKAMEGPNEVAPQSRRRRRSHSVR